MFSNYFMMKKVLEGGLFQKEKMNALEQ
ncbi:not available [Bacillus cereus]|nr:not available [Bacillus cereus]